MSTALRSDLALRSASAKHLLLIELEFPGEDCMEETDEGQRSKYQEVEKCSMGGAEATL